MIGESVKLIIQERNSEFMAISTSTNYCHYNYICNNFLAKISIWENIRNVLSKYVQEKVAVIR